MVFRLFIGLAVLLALYAGYEAYRLYAPPGLFARTPDVMAYGFGPEDADLTVEEFLDYSCPYCRDIDPALMEAVERDGRVRYIPRPIYSASEEGSRGARIFYAAAVLGKHREAHNVLISTDMEITQENFKAIAEAIGLSFEALAHSYNDRSSAKAVKKNYDTFTERGGQATPTFFIGDTKFLPEGKMPTADDFIDLFNAERGKTP